MPLTKQQQDMRRSGIGGSEIASLVGLNPYAGPFEVYRNKTGDAPEEIDNDAIRRGIHLEPAILSWYAADFNRDLDLNPGTQRHPEHSVALATPDALSYHKRDLDGFRPDTSPILVEVKCPGWRAAQAWGQPGTDLIPAYYWPQVQWQMGVFGLSRCHVLGFFNDTLNLYTVDFDAIAFRQLVDVANAFWRNHVVPRKPPEPDASGGCESFLLDRFPKNTAPVKPADEKMTGLMAAWRNLEAESADITQRLKAVKNEVRAWLGDAEGAEGPEGKVTWRCNKPSQVLDVKALVAGEGLSQDVLKRYTSEKPGARVLRASFGKA